MWRQRLIRGPEQLRKCLPRQARVADRDLTPLPPAPGVAAARGDGVRARASAAGGAEPRRVGAARGAGAGRVRRRQLTQGRPGPACGTVGEGHEQDAGEWSVAPALVEETASKGGLQSTRSSPGCVGGRDKGAIAGPAASRYPPRALVVQYSLSTYSFFFSRLSHLLAQIHATPLFRITIHPIPVAALPSTPPLHARLISVHPRHISIRRARPPIDHLDINAARLGTFHGPPRP